MKKIQLIHLICAVVFGAQTASGYVAFNSTNFPDENFRNYISETMGISLYTLISDQALSKITNIDVSNKEISSLKGIEYFTNLKYLHCNNNNISELDMTHNTKLTGLICNDNKLSSIDVSTLSELDDFRCYNNSLTSLNLTNCTRLRHLECNDNNLPTLNISNNLQLKDLYCGNNPLTDLNVSANSILEHLHVGHCNLSVLDVRNNPSLKTLYCYDNQLESLNLRNNTELEKFHCGDNKLSYLDISACTKLRNIDTYGNRLVSVIGLDKVYSLSGSYSEQVFFGKQVSTRRFERIDYNGHDAWGLNLGMNDASRIVNLTIDGASQTAIVYNNYLVVSTNIKYIPRKIVYEFQTYAGKSNMDVTVNYHVINYGIYIDGQELTSLNMFDIPGIKNGKAHLEDVPLGSGENYYVWGRYPTLVLEDAVIESEGIAIYNEDNVDFKIDVTGDCTISSKKENALELDIATNTTIQGGGTLHMFTLSEGYDAIESWAVAHLIVQDNTTLIVESNYGAAYYERDDAIFEIYNGGVFCARSKNYVSVGFDNTENNVLGDGIALRYPVGAYVKKHGVCYADGSEVSKDWVVFGPEGAAPPVEENSITTAIDQVQSSSQSEAAEPSAKLKVQSDGWYTIDGRRLSGKPNTKGVYIHNGRAVVH